MRVYEEQLRRTERFLQRISTPSARREEYEDFLWAFFQNCWHLKDWVSSDTSISSRKRKAVVSDVHKSKVLAICQNIANRSKHYRLRRKQTRKAKVIGAISITIAGESAQTSVDYFVTERKKMYPAIPFAQQAVAEWKSILARNHL